MSTITSDVFHDGELAVQQRAGAVVQGRNSGRMISDRIIPGAIKFVRKQPLLVVGSVDEQGDLWVSMLVGQPGFIFAEPQSLQLDLSQALRIANDPLWSNVEGNTRVGLLAIDLRTRARLRINGRAEFVAPDLLRVTVEQSYPNCPQYIQRRIFRPSIDVASPIERPANSGSDLGSRQRKWIASADTLFVASQHPAFGVDASHRGGNPGFVQVLDSKRLRIPDYAGNGMFNTLGNFAVNPRAGLVFPDFENGRTLQLTGTPRILWDVEDQARETGGTRRYWEFEIQRCLQIDNVLPGTAEFVDYAPQNPIRSDAV